MKNQDKLISAYKYYLSKKIERQVEWKYIDNPSNSHKNTNNQKDGKKSWMKRYW